MLWRHVKVKTAPMAETKSTQFYVSMYADKFAAFDKIPLKELIRHSASARSLYSD